MRNMSFALTTDQIRAGTKTVTRRLGWLMLKPGDLILPVKKCMGLKPGEKIEPLRAPLRIVSVRRERLDKMTEDIEYGIEECKREGFGDHPTYCWPSEFVAFFCASHRPCEPSGLVTRIEFEYTADQPKKVRMLVMDLEAEARRLFAVTRDKMGWRAPEWDELHEQTRELYRDEVRKRESGVQSGQPDGEL